MRAAKSVGIEHRQLLDLIHKDSTTQTEIKNNLKSSDKDAETVTPIETSSSVTLDNSEEKLLESKSSSNKRLTLETEEPDFTVSQKKKLKGLWLQN